MQSEPIPGQSYRYEGERRSHYGRVGVASGIIKRGRVWECVLANHAAWTKAGIDPTISVLSSELEPWSPPMPDTHQSSDAFDGPESELVAEITKALETAGYRVAVVGQLKAKGSGTTMGYPDMSVRRPTWPRGMVCLLEVKTATGTLLPEQETFHAGGWSFVVRSVEYALQVVAGFQAGILQGWRP